MQFPNIGSVFSLTTLRSNIYIPPGTPKETDRKTGSLEYLGNLAIIVNGSKFTEPQFFNLLVSGLYNIHYNTQLSVRDF